MHSGQIHALTGIRGIAALWVVILHGATYVNASSVLPQWLSNIINKGWLGVDLFFILSGFVIAYVHQSDFVQLKFNSIKQFLKLRLARIYPAHLVATLILIPIVVTVTLFSFITLPANVLDNYDFKKFLFSLSLTNGWGFEQSIGWNYPSWSVASEWFAYLLFPLIAWILNNIKSTKLFATIIFCIFILMYVAAIKMNGATQYMPQAEWLLLRVISEFIVGCCLYNIYTKLPRYLYSDSVSFTTILVIILLCFFGVPSIFDGIIVMLFSLLILNLSHSKGLISRFLSTDIMLFLGRISYSIYLTHFTVLIIFNQVMKRIPFIEKSSIEYLVTFYIGYIILSIISGKLLFSWVENPCRKFLKFRWVENNVNTPKKMSNS